jgi:hypothetical protein
MALRHARDLRGDDVSRHARGICTGGGVPSGADRRRARRADARGGTRPSVRQDELDSLGDVVSFGVAPASIAFAAGVNTA